MDRTAWIVVALCVIGLVGWQIYIAKQMPPRPARVNAASGQASPTATPKVFEASPPPAAPETTPKTAEPAPSFAEKIETLRNSDVELRLTNRQNQIRLCNLRGRQANKSPCGKSSSSKNPRRTKTTT